MPPTSVAPAAPAGYVATDDAARTLGVSLSTLYRRLRRLGLSTRTIPSAIGGTRAYVRREDLEQLVALGHMQEGLP